MVVKNSLLVVAAVLLFLNGQTQDTIPLYSDALAKQRIPMRPGLGIDVYQAVWFIRSALTHDSPATYAYPVSVTLYLPAKSTADQ